MSKRLKILFIPKWYPSRVHEYNGDFIRRHALSVALMHDVSVLFISADPRLKNKIYDTEFEVDHGVTTVRVFYNNSLVHIPALSSIIKFYRYLKACRMGIKMIKERFGAPDISHVHVLLRTFLPAYFLKTPFVVSEQWSGYLPEDGMYKGFLKKIITKIAIRKASGVTTVSESLKKAMLSHGLKNIYSVVPNVVDVSLFFPSEKPIKNDRFIFLHVSNLVDRAKNVSGMIRVMKILSESRNDFEFHVVGDGPERRKLEALAGTLNLSEKHVFFLGTKNSSEVAEIMRNADLFLLFSNYDNMPCVMVESLASGLPVVGSAIHGISEHINESRGILVPSGDEKALCDAIIKAMNNIGSYDKMELQAYAKENFSFEAVAQQFDTIYQQAVRK